MARPRLQRGCARRGAALGRRGAREAPAGRRRLPQPPSPTPRAGAAAACKTLMVKVVRLTSSQDAPPSGRAHRGGGGGRGQGDGVEGEGLSGRPRSCAEGVALGLRQQRARLAHHLWERDETCPVSTGGSGLDWLTTFPRASPAAVSRRAQRGGRCRCTFCTPLLVPRRDSPLLEGRARAPLRSQRSGRGRRALMTARASRLFFARCVVLSVPLRTCARAHSHIFSACARTHSHICSAPRRCER